MKLKCKLLHKFWKNIGAHDPPQFMWSIEREY